MTTLALDGLLADAHLVMDYATRSGLLPDDSLPSAVEAVERDIAAGKRPDAASLLKALSNAVRAIAPLTLVDLRAGRSPFDHRNETRTRRTQFPLSVFTIVLIALIAYYMQALHREQAALDAIQQVQDLRPLEKLNEVRKMAQFEAALERRDSQYDQYHTRVNELIQIQDKMANSYLLVLEASQAADFPFQRTFVDMWTSATAPRIKATDGPTNPPADQPGTAAAPPDDQCAEHSDSNQASISLIRKYPPWLQHVFSDALDNFCFSLKVQPGGSGLLYQPSSRFAPALKERIELHNVWVLPFLYGMLGASVLLMRNLFNPRTPNIEVAAGIMRIALGGIAGIVIGWFWLPIAASNPGLGAINSVPFGLAFLTGYGIDTLFSLLDRMNRKIAAPAEPAKEERGLASQ